MVPKAMNAYLVLKVRFIIQTIEAAINAKIINMQILTLINVLLL